MTENTTQETAVEQDSTMTEAPQPEATDQQDTFDREYVEKLRKEAASYRTRLKEVQEQQEAAAKEAERAKMDEVERLKADLAERDAKMSEYEKAIQRERNIRELTGKVVDPEAAYKLAEGQDDMVNEDGTVNVDKLTERFAFLAPPQGDARPAPVAASNPAKNSKDAALGPEDFRGKPADWVRANLHRLRSN